MGAALPSLMWDPDDPPPELDFAWDTFESVSMSTVRNLLVLRFLNLIGNPQIAGARIVVSDEQYLTCPAEFARGVAVLDPMLSAGAYIPQVFDCDDYVQFLRLRMSWFAVRRRFSSPLAVGFLLTDRHAFNFGVNPAGQIYLLNTQSANRDVATDPSAFRVFLDLVDPQTGHPNGNQIVTIYI